MTARVCERCGQIDVPETPVRCPAGDDPSSEHAWGASPPDAAALKHAGALDRSALALIEEARRELRAAGTITDEVKEKVKALALDALLESWSLARPVVVSYGKEALEGVSEKALDWVLGMLGGAAGGGD